MVGDWAKFFQSAEPYDSHGLLKQEWLHDIETMDKEGELVTAKKLLEFDGATPTKAPPLPATEGSLVEKSAPLAELLILEPVASESLPTTAKVGAKDDQLARKHRPLPEAKLPVPTRVTSITNSDLTFSRTIKGELSSTDLLPRLSEFTFKSLTKQTFLEQPGSTTAKLFSVNSNSAFQFSPPKSLPSTTSPLLTPPSGGEFKFNFASPLPWEIPSRSVITPKSRGRVMIKKLSARNPSVAEEDQEAVRAPPYEKPPPDLIPLPLSPPPSPLEFP